MIINKHSYGAPFDFLVQQYAMDDSKNQGGDTGWFSAESNNFPFAEEIINGDYPLNSLLTVDFPERQESYIILTKYTPKTISEIKVLKIEDSKG